MIQNQENTMYGRIAKSITQHRLAVTATVVKTAVMIAATLIAKPVAAANNSTINETAPYYTNQSSNVGSSAWFAGIEEMSLPTLGTMATRTLEFLIGPGTAIPGGDGGLSGPIIMGLVIVGVMMGSVAGTRIGAPAGAVVSLVGTFGLISVGLAPEWIKIVVLGLLGLVTTAAVLRTTA